LIYKLSREEFIEDTRRAKEIIEQTAGAPVLGYRAPSYSVTRDSLWALDALIELGFTFDSSIFPIRHDTYGIPDAPRSPFRWRELVEFPITTFRLPAGGPNLPVAGGGYLRIFPFWYTKFGVTRAHHAGLPILTYLHPWEIDPQQPRLAGRRLSRFRHYSNLDTMTAKVKRLCSMVNYTTFGNHLKRLNPAELPEWTAPGR
jgi:polysaccharide deacetylase family protein (PEP-CTERM system associated)